VAPEAEAEAEAVGVYPVEQFTDDEQAILRPYFTNLDRPVFAVVNLPEVVKGALFARYSRSSKSLRRLFLDEFVADLDLTGDLTVDATVGLKRAEALYERVFLEYGDDSVAQLGGVHLACEQASNLLTKILEWGRVMSYMEQSTRYIPYDTKLGGRYRYYRDRAVLADPELAWRYIADLDALFDTYTAMLPRLLEWARERYPKESTDSDFVYKQTIKAKACDAARGILPAATLSNVGVYGSGQAFEALLLRMRSHPLPEAGSYAVMMLEELRKVIPSFVARVDRADRGVVWSDYLAETRADTAEVVHRMFGDAEPEPRPSVTLTDFDPDAEDKLLAAICYPHTRLPDDQILARVRNLGDGERFELLRAYVGARENRRHRPGRAFERVDYRFDIVSDYGAFRDLQRHRMLTIEWQPLCVLHGYDVPEAIDEAGLRREFDDAMTRSAELYTALAGPFPEQASYAVSLAYRIRFAMQMNAREAMHLLELRTMPSGHPAYRQVAQEMHRLIAEQAGHHAIADAMSHVDHTTYELERLAAERAADTRRASGPV
jgi:thymidylate synthase ThyX